MKLLLPILTITSSQILFAQENDVTVTEISEDYNFYGGISDFPELPDVRGKKNKGNKKVVTQVEEEEPVVVEKPKKNKNNNSVVDTSPYDNDQSLKIEKMPINHWFGEVPEEQQPFVCPQYYHYNNGTCQENQCYCNGGQRSRPCLVHESESCESCQRFYLLTEQTDPKTGKNLGTSTCELFCPNFYHLSTDSENGQATCKRNYCQCYMGNPTENCFEHGETSCQSCYDFHDLYKNQTTGAMFCDINCPAGYRRTDDGVWCQPNRCECSGGKVAVGANCTVDGSENCESCDGDDNDNDHHGSFRQLVANPEVENAKICQLSCPDNYHVPGNSTICQQNRCYCHGGSSATDDCKVHESEHCESCFANFQPIIDPLTNLRTCQPICSNTQHLSDSEKSCETNICTCQNGDPDRQNCTEHNSEKCTRCYYGHEKIGDFCVKIPCQCENGVAKEFCDLEMSSLPQQCESCDVGFKMDGFSCVEDEGGLAGQIEEIFEQK